MPTDTTVGYLRLSQDGHSIERHRRDVEAYANTNGFALVEIYNEGKRASADRAIRKYTIIKQMSGIDRLLANITAWDARMLTASDTDNRDEGTRTVTITG